MSLKKLALDVYRAKKEGRVVVYNEVSGDEALRNGILQAMGGKLSYNAFKKNQWDVYSILEEVISLPAQEELKEMFGGRVSVDHVAFGDKKVWKIRRPQAFKVATIAAGTQDLRRDKIAGKENIVIDTDYLAVKVYTELEDFLTGNTDFAAMIDDVKTSFERETVAKINEAFKKSFSGLKASLKPTGTLTEAALLKLVGLVEGTAGVKCDIYGTKLALSKIAEVSKNVSEKQKEKYSELAHFGTFFGTDLVEMKQIYNEDGTGALEDDKLYVLPQGMDLIKVVYEGDPTVFDGSEKGGENRNDLQIEFFMRVKMGVGVLVPNFYGVYTIS